METSSTSKHSQNTNQIRIKKPRSLTPSLRPRIINITPDQEKINTIKEKIKRKVKDFIDLSELTLQYWNNIIVKAKFIEKVIVEAEAILDMFKIAMTQVTKQFESTTIKPLSKKERLAAVLMIIIPELCNLPYSFIMKLKIKTIVFCDELVSNSSTQNRYLPFGIIEVNRCENSKKTLDYFYSIVLDHFLLQEPGFVKDWSEFLALMYPNKLQKRNCLADIIETMQMLFSQGKKSFSIQDNEMALKAWKLRNKLNEFDPEGFRKPATLKFEYSRKEVIPYGKMANNLKMFSVNETKLRVF